MENCLRKWKENTQEKRKKIIKPKYIYKKEKAQGYVKSLRVYKTQTPLPCYKKQEENHHKSTNNTFPRTGAHKNV